MKIPNSGLFLKNRSESYWNLDFQNSDLDSGQYKKPEFQNFDFPKSRIPNSIFFRKISIFFYRQIQNSDIFVWRTGGHRIEILFFLNLRSQISIFSKFKSKFFQIPNYKNLIYKIPNSGSERKSSYKAQISKSRKLMARNRFSRSRISKIFDFIKDFKFLNPGITKPWIRNCYWRTEVKIPIFWRTEGNRIEISIFKILIFFIDLKFQNPEVKDLISKSRNSNTIFPKSRTYKS